MSKRTLLAWFVEFAAVTAIAVILKYDISMFWIVVPVILILGAKLFEYAIARREHREIVRRQLQMLLALLPMEGRNVRCTYHYPTLNHLSGTVTLIQAFDYLPDGGGGGRGFPVEKGIIGKAFSAKGPRVENFADDEQYRRRMIEEYNYSTSDVGKRRADRRSYACYPIVDENHTVLGLIYLDANVSGTFSDDEHNPRWCALQAAAATVRAAVLRA